MTLFEAYVTNLGKYNEGELVGEYLKFPTTPEEVQALLKRIGIDGVRYEEIFITDFDGDVLGLYDHLGEYESIDELNHLACVISELDQSDLEKFEAVIDSGEYTGSVKELINLAQNLDCFEFYSGISNEEELGRMYIEDFEALQIPEHLIDYIDYEAYGRDSTMRHTGGMSVSTRVDISPPGAMCSITTVVLLSTIPGWRTFPTSIRFSPCPSSTSGNRWPPTRRSLTVPRWRENGCTRGRRCRSDNKTSGQFVPKKGVV